MYDIHIESALKLAREEQERAARRALQEHELELLRKETPRGTGMHLRLAQDSGLLFGRKLRPSKR